jgi:hypothetical protein
VTTALGIGAALLAVGAAAQAVRIGIRHGDWMPLSIGIGITVATGVVYLLLVLIAPHTH